MPASIWRLCPSRPGVAGYGTRAALGQAAGLSEPGSGSPGSSRRDKVIGSSLEAHVHLIADHGTYEFLKRYQADLGTIFIVSTVTLSQGSEREGPLKVSVEKSKAGKCERCWNYREAVGADAHHPTLCDRCVEAVR